MLSENGDSCSTCQEETIYLVADTSLRAIEVVLNANGVEPI